MRRRLAAFATALLAFASQGAGAADKIRFAVGPFQPTASDTRKAYEPFFAWLAEQLGAKEYEIQVTTDWAGLAVALANDQADIAWMGPWGYVLANNEGGAQAIATVKYDGKPTYHAIIVGRPGNGIEKFPDDAKGRSISFADAGSTSGWLIPTYWFRTQNIDPRTYFRYRDGAAHPANELAVATGQVDLATDYDRNRDAMIEKGTLAPDATAIVWTSEKLPNDPLVVRKSLDPNLVAAVQTLVLAMDDDTAKRVMPAHYTGWVKADHGSYKLIQDAGVAVGKLKPKT